MTSRITPRFKKENTSNAAISESLGEYLLADLKYGRRVADRRKQRREEQHIAREYFETNHLRKNK